MKREELEQLRREVARIMKTHQGEVIMTYLKHACNFDGPVFQSGKALDPLDAALRDGGRQLVISLIRTSETTDTLTDD